MSEDKVDILNIIFEGTWPHSWSNSLADMLDNRAKAFAELLDNQSLEVREFANIKLELIKKSAQENRAMEREMYSQREQKFE